MRWNFSTFTVLVSLVKPTMLHFKILPGVLFLLALVGCSSAKPHEPPAAWRMVNGGMTRQEISRLIGPPVETLVRGSDLWVKAGWELHVEYDQYGRARNILSQPSGR
jgi:hypothetical protein